MRVAYTTDVQNVLTHFWQNYRVNIAMVSSFRDNKTGQVTAKM
jgi:hypothetical protein